VALSPAAFSGEPKAAAASGRALGILNFHSSGGLTSWSGPSRVSFTTPQETSSDGNNGHSFLSQGIIRRYSGRSFSFSSGIKNVGDYAAQAPPTAFLSGRRLASQFRAKDTSPVKPRSSRRNGICVSTDTIEVTIAKPPDGNHPLGVAPSRHVETWDIQRIELGGGFTPDLG